MNKNKLALNFICKNESHIILEMLESIKDITDLIVFNDTGSTDNTIEVIMEFGQKNNIPTYCFEREFDNFSNSRNYALEKLKEVVSELNWNPNDVYHYWIDCDEVMIVDKFKKSDLLLDFYMIDVRIENSNYTRNTFFRLSKDIRWVGPIHEYLHSEDKNITTGKLSGITTNARMLGNSWTGDLSKKYKKYSILLENYINDVDRNPRWVFYTAQSYFDSALTNTNPKERKELFRRSLYYYNERLTMKSGINEEVYWSQFRISCIYDELEYPINEISSSYLKTYDMDPLRVEPIMKLVDMYIKYKKFNMAYIYTSYMMKEHLGKFPYPTRMLFLDESMYKWRILDIHCAVCYYTNRKDEGKDFYKNLIDIMKSNTHLFNQDDINKINNNSKYYL